MTQEMTGFFKTLNDHTRTTYYVLPLISLNKFSFGSPENFVNAYLSNDSSQVIVLVKSAQLVYPALWTNEYLAYHDNTHLIFDLPDEFIDDIKLFVKGRYSKMSEQAKEQIRQHSGLNYNLETKSATGTTSNTDARLYALDKDTRLRDYLENLLNIRIDNDSELISPPGQDEIWKEDSQPA